MSTRQRGFTSVELIVAITIISGIGATVLALMATMSQRSAEAMTDTRRATIAKSYLDEILSKPFACASASSARADYDCVDDYAAIVSEPVTDRFGTALPDFEGYSVAVVITRPSTLRISNLPPVPSGDARRVLVRVTDPFGGRTDLIGVRTRHP